MEPPVTELRPAAPLPGRKAKTTGIPAVPPPANFRRASGAKEKGLG